MLPRPRHTLLAAALELTTRAAPSARADRANGTLATAASLQGEHAEDRAGEALAPAGDMDGDGFDDVLIGAPGAGGDATGRAYLVLGRAHGWGEIASLAAADASFLGEAAGDRAGEALCGAGDVDGDGDLDLLLAAPGSDLGGSDAGALYLLLGQDDGTWSPDTQLSTADTVFIATEGDAVGTAVAGPVDLDGDGLQDLLAGAPGSDLGAEDAGEVWVVFGRADGWPASVELDVAGAAWVGTAADDAAGSDVSGAGDVDGDGIDDLIIGAPGADDGAGQALLVLGSADAAWTWSTGRSLDEAAASLDGEAAGDGAGSAVAGAGDVDGDGIDDLIIGAPGNDERDEGAGQAYLVLGRASGWTAGMGLAHADASFWGDAGGDAAGWSVASAGDTDGDGLDDLFVGAPGNDVGGTDAGKAYTVLGRADGWASDAHLQGAAGWRFGEHGHDVAGSCVVGVGDVDGNGTADQAVGAPGSDEAAGDLDDPDDGAGQVYLLGIACADTDGDGYAAAGCGGDDCDDDDPTVYPGAPEDCDDGVDGDCDGAPDDADTDCGGGDLVDSPFLGIYTGGGLRCAAGAAEHAPAPWSWVIVAGFVALLGRRSRR